MEQKRTAGAMAGAAFAAAVVGEMLRRNGYSVSIRLTRTVQAEARAIIDLVSQVERETELIPAIQKVTLLDESPEAVRYRVDGTIGPWWAVTSGGIEAQTVGWASDEVRMAAARAAQSGAAGWGHGSSSPASTSGGGAGAVSPAWKRLLVVPSTWLGTSPCASRAERCASRPPLTATAGRRSRGAETSARVHAALCPPSSRAAGVRHAVRLGGQRLFAWRKCHIMVV